MILAEVFPKETFCVPCKSKSKDALFEEIVAAYLKVHPSMNFDAILDGLKKRESKMTTGIFPQIALPHCQAACIEKISGVVAVSADGVDYDSIDGKPVRLAFAIFAPENEPETYLRTLKRLGELLQKRDFVQAMMNAENAQVAFDLLRDSEQRLLAIC